METIDLLRLPLPIRYSSRAKRMSVMVHTDGRWEIVIPKSRNPSFRSIKMFVHNHQDWIQDHIAQASKSPKKQPLLHQGISRFRVEVQTRRVVTEHVAEFKQIHPFRVSRIKLGSFKSQWGSCSKTSNLSFHYKLSLLPEHLCRYVVAHELSHTVHFNHSKSFWEFMETVCPGAKRHRRELQQFML